MTRDILESIQDRHMIFPRGGHIEVETLLARQYPDVNVGRLCDLLADFLFDWDAAITSYMEIERNERRRE